MQRFDEGLTDCNVRVKVKITALIKHARIIIFPMGQDLQYMSHEKMPFADSGPDASKETLMLLMLNFVNADIHQFHKLPLPTSKIQQSLY